MVTKSVRTPATVVASALLLWAVAACRAPSFAETGTPEDRRAIEAAGKAYQAALEKGDAAAIAKLWMPDGNIVDDRGETITAKELVAQETAAAKTGRAMPQVKLSETAVRFLSAEVAIEDGTAEVTIPGVSGKIRGHFTAGWFRSPEGWKLSFLRESRLDPASGRAKLSDLEPLVGTWKPATTGDRAIRINARWNRDKTFLLRDMTIVADDKREIEVNQRIGIDPVSGGIHSWNFSSDGGHGEGIWTRDADAWVAHTTAVSPDGTRTASFNVYSLEDGGRLRWRSFPTSLATSHAPPVDMVFVKE